ncbi:IBR domain-containing protein [Magnaporthiopsis poae ATCC 64411]|uniref:RBR-type E3 ubiquitin transferase n=1 Tax=Magnaporthiopsis poae (strain ATCC 64411 / 73-15) TaxID=644358 RepID=A0A0C4DQ65_MAGP6|nr:IBR domain-containing protein [Magnaporthiopsis poae ATCC 64411]
MGSLATHAYVSALQIETQREPTAGHPVGSATSRSVPELQDSGFFSEVLGPDGNGDSEASIDAALATKAAALGITVMPKPATSSSTSGSSALSSDARPTTPDRSRRTPSHSPSSSDSTAASAVVTPNTSPMASQPCSWIVPSPKPTAVLAVLPDEDYTSPILSRRRSRNLSFSQYDKYVAQVDPNLKQPKFVKETSPSRGPAPSMFSFSTRKSIAGLRNTLKSRLWRRKGFTMSSTNLPLSCICCREDFSKTQALQTLPCGHTYCNDCLRIMINQSIRDESKMPPRCCTQPIPSTIARAVLGREEQQLFLKAVLQFSTPWESRIFCPNSTCGEFIRPRGRIDPKHPFDVVCRRCRTRVCIMCKRDAHPLGQDCPADWELEAVLKMGEKSGWRRCYKCRTLVELSQGCTHMTCRCKAQFCYICGAVWDGAVGCPNYCNGEEELERRRLEEEARMAELEAEKEARELAAKAAEAERKLAVERSAASPEFSALAQELEAELERFVVKMRERHTKTTQHLEDRQIAAEMDLRATLEQRARSVKIRLRHMEAYCDGLGRNMAAPLGPDDAMAGVSDSTKGRSGTSTPRRRDSMMPTRVVTERDLRELGQQYNVRDDLERLHQSRINVLRDRQTKNMEELLERQEAEMERLLGRRDEEIEDLEARFAAEDDAVLRAFADRRERARARWSLRVEILRREMEHKSNGLKYGPIPIPDWPPACGTGGATTAESPADDGRGANGGKHAHVKGGDTVLKPVAVVEA